MDKKKIIVSAITIGATGALLIGATFAYFSDTSTSNDNLFRSGTLDLKVRDNNEGFKDDVTASTVTPSNWAPGQSHESYICFKNVGSIDIEEIILKMTASGGGALRPFVIAEKVELGTATATDCQTFTNANEGTMFNFTPLFVARYDGYITTDSKVTLEELLLAVDGTDRVRDDLLNDEPNHAYLPVGAIVKFRTTWRFDPAATNAAQGQTVTVKTTFTANQDEVN